MSDPFEGGPDNFNVFFCGALSNCGVRARPKPTGYIAPNIELSVRFGLHEGLAIRVHRDEFHAHQTVLDHAVNGIYAATTYSNHFNVCSIVHSWHGHFLSDLKENLRYSVSDFAEKVREVLLSSMTGAVCRAIASNQVGKFPSAGHRGAGHRDIVAGGSLRHENR